MYDLYLDESGKPSLTDTGISLPHFSIGGVIVHENSSQFINERSKQIKFKYFNRTDVVFHVYDIINNKKDFSIFDNNPDLKHEFLQDLKNFLIKANFKVVYVGINKFRYLQQNQQIRNLINSNMKIKNYEDSMVKKMFKNTFILYLRYLISKTKNNRICTGKITIEGSNEPQDFLCFTSYHNFLGGCFELNMTNKDVRNFLTSLCFSTKKSNLIEVELADMASYFLNWEHRFIDNKTQKDISINQEISSIFKQKLFTYKINDKLNYSWQDISL